MRIAVVLTILAVSAASSTSFAESQVELPEGVVVQRGGASVDLTLVDARLARVPRDKRAGFMNDPERIEMLLQSLLVTQQLALEAEQMGLAEDPVVQKEIELARMELLARKRLAAYGNEVQAPDFEQLARERYLSSPAAYKTKETRDFRHLIIMHRNHGVEGAAKRAAELFEQYKAGGQDFEAMVREFSEESTAKEDGGLLDNVAEEKLDDEFMRVAFALSEIGEVSPPTRSRYGYHLIQLLKINPSQKIPFEEVKESLISSLRQEHLKRVKSQHLDALKAQAELLANPDLVLSLRTRYYPDGPGAKALLAVDAASQEGAGSEESSTESQLESPTQ